MTRPYTIEGRALLPNGQIHDSSIVVDGGTIISVDPIDNRSAEAEPSDHLIIPAFIDLHVHGGGGHDFASADGDAIRSILETHAAGGTAALAATIVSSPHDRTLRAIETISATDPTERGAEICAIHLEGPFLNESRCGAQNPASLRRPDPDEVERWLVAADGVPLIVTIAPELEGALDLIERFPEIRFSIGHTNADYRTSLTAFEAGATRLTHLFNAMPGLHHRSPGLIAAALLTAGVSAELIADGHHVHPAMLQLVARWMPGRTMLVTDAISAAGSPNAKATLGGLDVEIMNGAARLADGTLAGSVITMRDALTIMVERAGVPIELVVPMMTSTPAREIGIDGRKGAIAPGMDADLLVLDSRLRIVRRFCRGLES